MKALEIANMIERYNAGVMSQAIFEDYLKAAAELRRLAAVEAELERIKALNPVAVRYDFDGYGWQYIDNGSGSDWLTRHKDGEELYALGSKT